MLTLLAIFHIIIIIALIGLVLLQDSKGGALGAFGSGGSSSIFGSSGGASFLVKTTRVVAILFAATSLSLVYITNSTGGSVLDDNYIPAAESSTQPLPKADAAPKAESETPAEANK